MNIKQSIFTLLLLMGVSFSAFSQDFERYSVRACGKDKVGIAPTAEGILPNFAATANGCVGSAFLPLTNPRVESNKLCGTYETWQGEVTYCGELYHQTVTCRDDHIYDYQEMKCVPPPPLCSAREGEDAPWPVGQIPNDDKPVTAHRIYCETGVMCEAVAGYALGSKLFKESYYTGGKCSDNFSGNENCQYMGTACDSPSDPTPDLEDPYPGCKKPYVESPFVCPEDTDGDGIPNPDAPFDEGANCSHDASGKFSCTGGTFDPETPNPNPEPNPDPEPETPKDPTSGIDNPSPLDPITSNPVVPKPVAPEEEVEPVPDAGTGNADIVTAIMNQNGDINRSLHALNTDNNENFALVNTKLGQLDENTKAINSNIALQLQQDIRIYEENKKLQIQNTQETAKLMQASDKARKLEIDKLTEALVGDGTQSLKGHLTKVLTGDDENSLASKIKKSISGAASSNNTAIGTQTEALTGAITAQTEALTGSINGQSDLLKGSLDSQTGAINRIGGKLDDFLDKIPEPCDPTPDNNYCENPHGLDVGYVETLFSQMDDSVGGMMSGASSTLVNTVQSTIDTPLTTEAESVVNDSVAILMDVIGINKSCSPLVLGSKNGKNIQIPCQVSEQIKMILSFLLGVYTIMTLIDILLDGITPLGSKPSATRYA